MYSTSPQKDEYSIDLLDVGDEAEIFSLIYQYFKQLNFL